MNDYQSLDTTYTSLYFRHTPNKLTELNTNNQTDWKRGRDFHIHERVFSYTYDMFRDKEILRYWNGSYVDCMYE